MYDKVTFTPQEKKQNRSEWLTLLCALVVILIAEILFHFIAKTIVLIIR